jgi:hypothetical protein
MFLVLVLRKMLHFGMLGMWITSRAHSLSSEEINTRVVNGDEEMIVLLLLRKKERKSL